MDRLRKSFRGSFRKKKDHHITESSKPHQWQADEQAVRSGTCSFPVKYLGCVEVFESRGMHVCEEALKLLRSSRRRPFTSSIKGTLFVTGDGLRVVDEETKGLIVDQTIEKVSFCAPDRNHEKGFSYICRDGTTRRWICHGFHALKDSGDRLSHAVGCAFAVCLERKQKRDKELVSMNFDSKTSTFTRTGSFRQASLTERLTDIQNFKPSEPPPIKPVHNPYAIERPHATPQLLQRQGSFRGLGGLSQSSPFKRQLSLRLNELPSNLGRTRSHSLESSSEQLPPTPRSNGALKVIPIPEASPASENKADSISAMCQELSQGLSLLSNNDDPLNSPSRNLFQNTQSFSQRDTTMATPSPIPVNDPFSAPATIPSSSPFSFNLNETRLGGSSPFDLATNDKTTSANNIPCFAPTTSNLTQSTLTATTSTTTTNSPITNPIYTGFNKNLTTQARNNSTESDTREFASFPPSHIPTGGPLTSKSNQLRGTSHSSFDSEFKPEKAIPADPFDADWVALGSRNENDDSTNIHRGTNPFIPSPGLVKAFQVQM